MAVFRILEARARPGAVDDIADLFAEQAGRVGHLDQQSGGGLVQAGRAGQVLEIAAPQPAGLQHGGRLGRQRLQQGLDVPGSLHGLPGAGGIHRLRLPDRALGSRR